MLPLKTPIDRLQSYYKNLHWSQRLLFPQALANALKDKSSKRSDIYEVFFDTALFTKFVLPGLRQFSAHKLYMSYAALRKTGDNYWIKFLDHFDEEEANAKQDQIDLLPHHIKLIKILELMNNEQALTVDEARIYFNQLTSQYCPYLYKTLVCLKGTGLLKGEKRHDNFSNLIGDNILSTRNRGIFTIANKLSTTQLLKNEYAQDNLNAIVARKLTHGGDLDRAVTDPYCFPLFERDDVQDFFKLIASHKHPFSLAQALMAIVNFEIDCKPFFSHFDNKKSIYDDEIKFILTTLKEHSILPQDSRTDFVWRMLKVSCISSLADILRQLIKNDNLQLILGTRLSQERSEQKLDHQFSNIELILSKDVYYLTKILPLLFKNELINPNNGPINFKLALIHNCPHILFDVLNKLDKNKSLTQRNFYINFFGRRNSALNEILPTLYEANLLTPQYASQIIEKLQCYMGSNRVEFIAETTKKMNALNLLTGDNGFNNYMALINKDHGFLQTFRYVMDRVTDAGLFTALNTQSNFELLVNGTINEHLDKVLCCLNTYQLLTQPVLIQIMNLQNIREVSSVLNFFYRSNLLHNGAESIRDQILSKTNLLHNLYERITPENLTAHWPTLTRILELPDLQAEQTLRRYVNNFILRITPPHIARNRVFQNTAQSTHTRTIHVSTDLTAWLLLEKNQNRDNEFNNLDEIGFDIQLKIAINKDALQKNIQQLQSGIKPLNAESLQVAQVKLEVLLKAESKMTAALDCLERIETISFHHCISAETKKTLWRCLTETDLNKDENIRVLLPQLETTKHEPAQISLQQFIILIYQEIKENAKTDDYIIAMIEALYEIQRGYNLDEDGNDNRGAAMSICLGGTLNKFSERMQGFSSLILFIFITETTIDLFIRHTLLDSLLQHCQELLQQAIEGDSLQKQSFCDLITKLSQDLTANDLFEDFFHSSNLCQKIKKDFKLYQILNGEEKLDGIINEFKEISLPYLPSIDTNNPEQPFYSTHFIAEFKRFIDAKSEFHHPSLTPQVVRTLHNIGLYSNVSNRQNEAKELTNSRQGPLN